MKRAVIVFQKALVLGEVKTRIAETLGAEKALEIYKQLLAHTHQVVDALEETEVFIFQNKFDSERPSSLLSNKQIHLQKGQDLGEKMKNAFSKVFQLGFEQVIIIGTDCLELTPQHLKDAFQLLSNNSCVIGPAKDGGYYLLGLQKMIPLLFKGIAWSTAEVFNKTCEILMNSNQPYALIESLSDIDTAHDWSEAQRRIHENQDSFE